MALGPGHLRSWSAQARKYLESLAPFSYDEPLQGRNIRLVQLLAPENGKPIQCKLVQRSLDSNVEYQALSYVWGNSNDKRAIACNDRRFEVTASLHEALVQLRANNGIRKNSLLWIDAICIDQSNIAEKTAQVKRMMEIYSHASCTIIWLGTRFGSSGEDILRGVELLSKICAAVAGLSSIEETMKIADRMIASEGEKPDQNESELWKLLMRDWFGRIWVVQEFVASTSCLIYIGPIVVEGGVRFFQAASILRFSRSWVLSPSSIKLTRTHPTVLNAGLFWGLKKEFESPQKMKLHELVVATATFDSTLPVDSIFALVGLASDVGPEFIDYSLDMRTVHINIAKNALASFRKGDLAAFDFLTCARGDYDLDETESFKLPSWAPNLRQFNRFNLHKALGFQPLVKAFPYSITVPLPGLQTVNFGTDESLQVKAVFLDKVAKVIDANVDMPPAKLDGEMELNLKYFDGFQQWEAKAHSLAMSLKRYPTNEDIFVVYSKTLSFDHLAQKNPNPDTRILSAEYARDYIVFQDMMKTMRETNSSKKKILAPSNDFLDTFDVFSPGRCFSTTQNGYMGWVPEGAQAGDDICVFPWSLIPFVVRQQEKGYQLIGGCYIDAFMKVDIFRTRHENAREIKIY
ncbi:HET-domain-containing protein [Mollisia scopiformis]|uniref:HET-domain-containing protein n=1 Tax=Mollisia scopiformis TaxID=149040 RepID=A0A194WZ79_MOLSC|nr:HET-domain-containing protein [Mollisia scopiformis]KUJ13256.1 HET-domain-containing protein [Mollisia scopiformis]